MVGGRAVLFCLVTDLLCFVALVGKVHAFERDHCRDRRHSYMPSPRLLQPRIILCERRNPLLCPIITALGCRIMGNPSHPSHDGRHSYMPSQPRCQDALALIDWWLDQGWTRRDESLLELANQQRAHTGCRHSPPLATVTGCM
jgi:hypothetical protein